ncbi:methyltransferase [Myxococcota bacterium]|nr:methyltransferase [Myxococcota bacterium]MCZ7616875.1 class I SAM-dependent methyltransferase [Myxococcota bacterium]
MLGGVAEQADRDGAEPRGGGIDGLNAEDPGARLLGATLRSVPPADLLLVHCGDLPSLSPGALRLILDVRERAGSVHRCVDEDLAGSSLRDDAGFAAAAVWPRAHLGLDFTEFCLARGAAALRDGGSLWCAVRKRKGGERIGAAMRALLGNLAIRERARGYRLFESVRHDGAFDAELARAWLERRYEIRDPQLVPLVLESAPGVFSRSALDAGTAALIRYAQAHAPAPGAPVSRVIDLCAGIGPLGLWAASRWPDAQVLAVESNTRAAALLARNAERAALASRVALHVGDGLPADGFDAFRNGGTALALLNPPTHAPARVLRRLVEGLAGWLQRGAPAWIVASRPGRVLEAVAASGGSATPQDVDRYVVVEARWG